MKRLLGLGSIALLTVAASAQWAPMDPVFPAYHKVPPKKSQPPILSGDALSGPYFSHHYQAIAYQMAEKVPDAIYQMPCFCWCDRALGHKSLHSCFEGTHGATCTVCMREVVYVYRQTKIGKTPAQIRTGIEHSEYLDIDLPTLKME